VRCVRSTHDMRWSASTGLQTSQIKKFCSLCKQDNVFRQFTAGNYMLKMWQADQGDCQLAQG
jgi:hypothetical protein